MNNVINLTANDLPPSPVFIDFLAHFLDPRGFSDETWHDQLSEELSDTPKRARENAGGQLRRLAPEATAEAAIQSAYDWFHQLATFEPGRLAAAA